MIKKVPCCFDVHVFNGKHCSMLFLAEIWSQYVLLVMLSNQANELGEFNETGLFWGKSGLETAIIFFLFKLA